MICQTIKHELFNPSNTWVCGAEADYVSLVDGQPMCFECASANPRLKPEFTLHSHILGQIAKVCGHA